MAILCQRRVGRESVRAKPEQLSADGHITRMATISILQSRFGKLGNKE
ncbi:MAG: hypothetical protein HP494_02340 [Nitrospira sp.]|nr:hypothetical protein [Nitrospira sp.]MBH0194447.1 hypothetical protein [Nitrospira sp.]